MTKEEKETIIKEINDLQEWMKDSCGETVQEEELAQMVVESGDIYEVFATIKLSGGDSLTIHNHCFDSFIRGQYCGDVIYVENDILFIEICDNEDNHVRRYIRTPISNVQLLDITYAEINWINLWNDYIAKHPGFKLPQRSNDDNTPVEDLSAMVKEVNDRFGFRLYSAIKNPYPIGLPIMMSIPHLSYGSEGDNKEH